MSNVSTRKIAEAVKANHSTIVRDLSGGANAPTQITGKDGKVVRLFKGAYR